MRFSYQKDVFSEIVQRNRRRVPAAEARVEGHFTLEDQQPRNSCPVMHSKPSYCYNGDRLTDVDAVQRITDVPRLPHVEEFAVDLETTHAAAEAGLDSRHVTDERQVTVSAKKHRHRSPRSVLFNTAFHNDARFHI